MQVIEAQCLLVLEPHDHLHIKQMRMRTAAPVADPRPRWAARAQTRWLCRSEQG